MDTPRDSLGRLAALTTKATATGAVQNLATGLTYQPFGPLTGLTFGNGLRTTHTFDLDGRLTALTSADGAHRITDWGLSYDAAGNLTTLMQRVNSAHNQTFTYDAIDRLNADIANLES